MGMVVLDNPLGFDSKNRRLKFKPPFVKIGLMSE